MDPRPAGGSWNCGREPASAALSSDVLFSWWVFFGQVQGHSPPPRKALFTLVVFRGRLYASPAPSRECTPFSRRLSLSWSLDPPAPLAALTARHGSQRKLLRGAKFPPPLPHLCSSQPRFREPRTSGHGQSLWWVTAKGSYPCFSFWRNSETQCLQMR